MRARGWGRDRHFVHPCEPCRVRVCVRACVCAGGAFTGLVLRFWGGALDAVKDDEENMFDDAVHWHVGADTLEQSNVTLPAPVNASLAAASSAAADGDGIKLRRTLTEMSETDAEQAMRAADRARESAI